MTTQAQHSYDQALADKDTAIRSAQALADDYRRKLDATREALHEALITSEELYALTRTIARDLATIRDERDGLMSRLGETIQGLMVGEGL